jgi:hypothetical protein
MTLDEFTQTLDPTHKNGSEQLWDVNREKKARHRLLIDNRVENARQIQRHACATYISGSTSTSHTAA